MLVPASGSEAELKERGSRFLGLVFRAESEQAASDVLSEIQGRYPDATHVCFAWRLGNEHSWRASDAGEPHGTAGPPILDAIRERDLFQVIVMVVRWFGGVKLGKGGLARAYRETARLVLEATMLQDVPDLVAMEFRVAAAQAGRVPSIVLRLGGRVEEECWEKESPLFRVQVPRETADEFRSALRDVTCGGVSFIEES